MASFISFTIHLILFGGKRRIYLGGTREFAVGNPEEGKKSMGGLGILGKMDKY